MLQGIYIFISMHKHTRLNKLFQIPPTTIYIFLLLLLFKGDLDILLKIRKVLKYGFVQKKMHQKEQIC